MHTKHKCSDSKTIESCQKAFVYAFTETVEIIKRWKKLIQISQKYPFTLNIQSYLTYLHSAKINLCYKNKPDIQCSSQLNCQSRKDYEITSFKQFKAKAYNILQ